MKRLMGVMCYAAFAFTIASYMVLEPHFQAEVRAVESDDRDTAGQDQAGREEKAQKAISLEIVWMNNCDPCRRVKLVAKDLQKEGYDIKLVYRTQDKRGTTWFPSLYYLGNIGGVVKTEHGYKSADHIKQYLNKK